jgi:UDP-GlcNAc3NAcA epimerase
MKILSVVGARPQFIKAAPVCRALAAAGIHEVLLHTGQHYDPEMSDIFFSELDIPAPRYHLGVGSGSHAAQTASMLTGIETALLEEGPDYALVYGDTNSTLAGVLAAAKLHIPVAHVEAGLRSYNRAMPEEINRVVADALSNLLFCPTATAAANLEREGITEGVRIVGDVMYDAILAAKPRADALAPALLDRLGVQSGNYLLATVHRASNTDDPANLRNIIEALGRCGYPVVFPLHPRTKAALQANNIVHRPSSIVFTDPLSYLEMIALEANAAKILTDSGGVQKEALWVGVPCITLRDETEWVETVELGWNTLTGTDPDRILAAIAAPRPDGLIPPIYGNGHAAEVIAEILQETRNEKRET